MTHEPRRLRGSAPLRQLVRETPISPNSLILPLFIQEGKNIKDPISSMPNHYRWSPDQIPFKIEEGVQAGVNSFMLFGIPAVKDKEGSGAWAENGVVQSGIREIKKRFPQVLLTTDICLCEYTDHGHCGHLEKGRVDNKATLPLLAKTALSHAQAGADMVAPSDMMDGRVRAIRECLDENGFSQLPIMSYSAKYASAFYGPFREAAGSAPEEGDRKGYQMDYHNRREAAKEVLLDIAEGADIVMVKPALSYLDIIRDIKNLTHCPVAAYSVSGEYSMIKAAAAAGYIQEYEAFCEVHASIYRSGADVVLSYWAEEAVGAIRKGDIG